MEDINDIFTYLKSNKERMIYIENLHLDTLLILKA